jgi:predicted enzyme related to lactoylglutathione lyase
MAQFKKVNVVYCYVRDWEGAKKFYREVLEWPVVFSDDQVGWEEYGMENETHIAINRWDSPDPMPVLSGTTVLTVENAHQVTENLRSRGVKCGDVVTIPYMVTYGTFYDPEGNRIQFASNEV